jgi:hypothetical protein
MFGHRDLGVYVSVTRGGALREGDPAGLIQGDLLHTAG